MVAYAKTTFDSERGATMTAEKFLKDVRRLLVLSQVSVTQQARVSRAEHKSLRYGRSPRSAELGGRGFLHSTIFCE
jgi:hypothetical protein